MSPAFANTDEMSESDCSYTKSIGEHSGDGSDEMQLNAIQCDESNGSVVQSSDDEGSTVFQPHQIRNGPQNWKKWHAMKLRRKLNELNLNDRGKQTDLIDTLEHYYHELPEKINNSNNPWIENDFLFENNMNNQQSEEVFEFPNHTNNDSENTHEIKNETCDIIPLLLVEITNILEILCLQSTSKQGPAASPNMTNKTLCMSNNLQPPPLLPIIPPVLLPAQFIPPIVPPSSTNTTNQWQEVQYRKKPRQSTQNHLKLENRYEVLANIPPHPSSNGETIKCDFCQQYVNNSEDLEMHLLSCKSIIENHSQKQLQQIQQANAKRPDIVISKNYVDKMQQKRNPQSTNCRKPTRPGFKSYAKASINVNNVSVVTDSMCRSIRNNYANSLIDSSVEKIHFNKFPGAHARQIKHYATWSIENGEADSIVILAGTNDINYDNDPSVEQISKRVLDIARQAKQMGVAPCVWPCIQETKII